MPRKLSNVLFTAIKRAARIQRQALKLVNVPVARKPRKAVKKKAAKQAATRTAAHRPKLPPAPLPLPTGKGSWQNFIHKTAPTGTELLGRLAYWLYSPNGRPVAGQPLIIMLHGCQQTSYEMALGSRMNRLADQKGFMVAYPQQAKRVQQMRCWRWFQPDAGHGLAEADAIASLAVALVHKYRLDAGRVYIAGLSAGAGMAALAALRYPNVFAAVATHSGAVLGAAHNAVTGLRAMRQASPLDPAELLAPLIPEPQTFPGMPIIILHGERDHVVSMRNAVQLAQQFSYLNAASSASVAVLAKGTHREYIRQDFVKSRRIAVRLCRLKEVGHAWSGGDSKLKFNSKHGPAASMLMWRFFAMHSR